MRLFNKNKIRIFLITTLTLLLVACGDNLKEDKEKYLNNMQPVYDMEHTYTKAAEQLDTSKIENIYVGTELKIKNEELNQYLEVLDETLIPLATEMQEKANSVEVTHKEIEMLHDSYLESIKLKKQFAQGLRAYLDIYQRSVDINKQLSDYGEKVLNNKKARDTLIKETHSNAEKKEIDELVKVINDNSETLEIEAMILQKDLPAVEKEEHIKNVLMPLLDEQISGINQLAIKTNKGKEVRTLSLEMFYTFKSYYEERANLMRVYEDERNYPLKNILPKLEVSKKVSDKYHKNVKKLDSKN
ncbi:EMYY motif lipoprotein [Phocicoccus pinnipedialis]|uniref:EMYY motif lipoprotein n=1 Tax=Phocicoccus pinnipedialis TaxID=110845 RepID=A0A6V7R088_9BACL|nr:EMYY motif lipoprotein [Jeotgalicoccus pinnipedialis]MBP1938771.1 hypothetical protein [Jeotgalicoccus pinnipedialis]CAD2070739.1 hypothetical protein JEOPIN946_00081 [Jeotgalicoccus pinnipedialis]